MESSGHGKAEQSKIQIYPPATTGVSPFWKDKYEKDANKYWDRFYRYHKDRFFKDRHYLGKEWGHYFCDRGAKVILEVGCGAGNTTFPLVASYPDVFVHACDFSPRAIELVKTHKEFSDTQVRAFVCDLTVDDLSTQISPSTVDIVTMIFVLSAVSPEKMPLVLMNIKKVLKPNGYVLFRDYAVGDLAQERLSVKDQKISENFYVRGDGTRAFYFTNDFLRSLFEENGFITEELFVSFKQVENRAREIVMNRRWVQAVFRFSEDSVNSSSVEPSLNFEPCGQEHVETESNGNALLLDDLDIDTGDSLIGEMFEAQTISEKEHMDINLGSCNFMISVLSKEYQHTCKSTGLMLWESARLMAYILARNPCIVAGKRVLELGSGCGGICAMAAARSATLVVATDGDEKALELLNRNISSNLTSPLAEKLTTRKLWWGNREDIEAIKDAWVEGFEIIIGTDVTYVPEAVLPLFSTARELCSSNSSPTDLVLCHVFRRVDEQTILSAAKQFGFRLVDRWPAECTTNQTPRIMNSWFSDRSLGDDDIPTSALHILYFQIVNAALDDR